MRTLAGFWSKCLRGGGVAALLLAVASSLITLTVRDVTAVTAVVMFGVPWLVRLLLVAIAWILLRPRRMVFRILLGVVALHAVIEAGRSFHWQPEPVPMVKGFDVTLWNAGRRLAKMSGYWKELAGSETKLVVLIEAGPFSEDAWSRFVAVHPEFTWLRLEGGIVVGVKGTLIANESLADRPRFRCHRLKISIDGRIYTVVAVDIPSEPWSLRAPYLARIDAVARGPRTLVLGDFNTPPSARGYDGWIQHRDLVNREQSRGFEETWLYGLPVLTLDQLWLSRDLQGGTISRHPTLRSDHVRMTFRVGPLRTSP